MKLLNIIALICGLSACAQTEESQTTAIGNTLLSTIEEDVIMDSSGTTVETRFNPPPFYLRESHDSLSQAYFLRNLPLKPAGSLVQLYDGSTKDNYGVYEAVVDLPIGNKDLHQCADAIMRLRAEYLWQQQRYDEIHFNFTNGFKAEYSKWIQGNRISVSGNNVKWVKQTEAGNSPAIFWSFLERVFMYAGTLSLEKEMTAVPIDSMQIGDVFIRGGSPGHGILVIDLVYSKNGQKQFLLAQSYMPAQEIQILKNPMNPSSPWYEVPMDGSLQTPEWSFSTSQLRRFKRP